MSSLRYAVVVIVIAVAAGVAIPHGPVRSTDQVLGSAAGSAHLAVIVMENKAYSQIIGNANASYINGTLIPSGRLYADYFAVLHPSLPNYLVMASGSNSGCVTDGCLRNSIPGSSLFGEMNNGGLSWKVY